ncbi:amidohydrolase family protein [Rugosimonospora acidiphila]|uniref:Amidohydrolase family protein n=1 Tax=Rugosimonospora acidiphila TaxID=556531 RepID=A0ABP9S4J0_9ACTN
MSLEPPPPAAGGATIDVHTHVVPDGLPFGVTGDPRWPVLRTGPETGDVLVDGALYRTVARTAWDLEARRADLPGRGCHAQVLSPMPHLFSYWAPIAPALDFSRALNTWLADAVRAHPGVFYGLGTVPLQEPEAAAAELATVKALGLSGVELGTNVNGVSIADPRFRDVFVEADRLGLAVFLHAFQPPMAAAVPGPAASAVCFPLDIALAVAGLIANGTLEASPTLRLLASHGGGGLGLALPRLIHTWRTKAPMRKRLPTPPEVVARRLFYDILLFDPAALRYLIDFVGTGQIVIGSDYPFLDVPPEWPLTDLDLPGAVRLDIQESNARAFLGL